ncbi:MAG: hypothetical protein AB8G05_21610 [Oligoflexales bacterium]
MKNQFLLLMLNSIILFSTDVFARSVIIENHSPYIFSVYTNSCVADVLNIYNYKYEHISENGTEGDLIEIDLDLDQSISFYFRQINKGGEQIIAEAELVTKSGIKAFGFYNILNGIKDNINKDSLFLPYLDKYFPYVSAVATTFIFGYELINKSLTLPGIVYEEVSASSHDYKISIKEHDGRIFLQKMRVKEKQE